MGETTKQRLLQQAAELMGYGDLANGLGVDEKTLKHWISGEETMPDSKLRLLADLLNKIADSRNQGSR